MYGGPYAQGHRGEFNCALQKRILLQGRLYLFDSYVCFYSNLFGYVHTKVIPLADVTAVCKKKTALVVPNAIEVEHTPHTSPTSPNTAHSQQPQQHLKTAPPFDSGRAQADDADVDVCARPCYGSDHGVREARVLHVVPASGQGI